MRFFGPKCPIIIGGFYRSGTTLLRRLINAHSRIHCPTEIKFFKDLSGDYPEDPLAHARFFSTIRSAGLEENDIRRIFGRAYLQSRDLATRKAGKRRWADKNPENVLYLDAWHKLLKGRFIFVHVVRNPLDALASLDEIGFPKAVPAEFVRRIELYRRFLEQAAAYQSLHSKRTRIVRYENLVARPEDTLREFLRSIGERFEPSMLETAFSGSERGGLEDPKAAAASGIYNTSVGRWRARLRAEEARSAVAHFAPLYLKLGYDLAASVRADKIAASTGLIR